MNVALAYNLKKEHASEEEPPSPRRHLDSQAEWDDQTTIDAVRDALAERHKVYLVEANEEAYERFRQLRHRLDIVFNMAEGIRGASREAQIPTMLEFLGIPYTASDPVTLNICLDKARTKEILGFYGIPTARFRVVTDFKFKQNGLRYPLIVKPLHEGSSVGIFDDSVVNSRGELEDAVARVLSDYRQPALVEEFLQGREFTVAILGNGERARVLPIVEIVFDELPAGAKKVYSFEAKWVWDRPARPLNIFVCPAEIGEELQSQIEAICLRAYRVLRCRDWARMDVRLDENGKPHILEVNPLPGILPNPEDNSCFPKAARAAGMTYSQLINTVLDLACERYGII